MYSILLKTESIADKLQSYMNELSFKWKGSENTSDYEEQKPKVYAFTFDDLAGNTPLHTPSVLVQVINLDSNGIAKFVVYCCVCNPAQQGKEMTNPVQGEDNVYQYSDSDSIDTSFVRSELYRYALMLGEQVYLAIKKMGNKDESISDVSLIPPSPYMEKFPYCECSVTFDCRLDTTPARIDTDVWKYL